jgi:hypothetical protein
MFLPFFLILIVSVRFYGLLYNLYAEQVFIPSQVEEELDSLRKFSHYSWLPELLHREIKDSRIHKIDIIIGTDESTEFIKLTTGGTLRPMGKGEA